MKNNSKRKEFGWKPVSVIAVITVLLISMSTFSKVSAIEPSKADKSEIQGTWKLVSYNHVGDTIMQDASTMADRIKIINATSFCWLDINATNHLVGSSAGGSYTYNNGKYIERIEYGSSGMVGYASKDQVFNVTIENDKMYLSGSLSSGLRITEVWEKVSEK
jgi:hypothetical protein